MGGFSIYRDTRSVRLRVTTPDGEVVSIDNLRGDEGFRLGFSCTRSMNEAPGTAQVTALNLPPDVLGVLEAAQQTRVDDLDAVLFSKTLQSAAVDPDGADALAAGLLIVELEGGYDGTTSRVFKVIGARASTTDDYGARGYNQARSRDGRFVKVLGGVTRKTTIDGNECLDGSLLGLPTATFPAGSTLFEVVDYLRRLAGLGPGNLDYPTFTNIAGDARLDAPYHVSGGQALGLLKEVLKYYPPLRWFVDDREIWICARDGVPNPNGAVAWIADGEPEEPEAIIGRPARVDGGQVEVRCFLCPRIRPGRLVRLTAGGLALTAQGLAPTAEQVKQAQVPPGLYRCEQIEHRGTTGPGEFQSTMRLRAIVSAQPVGTLTDTERLLIDLGLA